MWLLLVFEDGHRDSENVHFAKDLIQNLIIQNILMFIVVIFDTVTIKFRKPNLTR